MATQQHSGYGHRAGKAYSLLKWRKSLLPVGTQDSGLCLYSQGMHQCFGCVPTLFSAGGVHNHKVPAIASAEGVHYCCYCRSLTGRAEQLHKRSTNSTPDRFITAGGFYHQRGCCQYKSAHSYPLRSVRNDI